MKQIGRIFLSLARYGAMWAYTGLLCTVSLIVVMVTLSQNAMLWLASHIWAPGMLWLAGVRVEIDGGDEVDWSKPHIFVANHQSSLDVMVGFVAIPVPLRFVAKKMFLYLPFFGIYMWASGMIFVDR
ncbi:MAG: lysophospholipid acyltransferase family protein, partial [Myxococcota bacterium]